MVNVIVRNNMLRYGMIWCIVTYGMVCYGKVYGVEYIACGIYYKTWCMVNSMACCVVRYDTWCTVW